MKKILILTNFDLGLYKFRKELLMELLKENEVYISLPSGDFISKLTGLGCIFKETPLSRRGLNPFSDLVLTLRYIRMINKIKPDTILTYTIKPNIYGGIACLISGKYFIPNITGLGTAIEKKGFIQSVSILLYKLAFRNAQCVFFQNKENRQFFVDRNIALGKHKLIPGSGVNLEFYRSIEYPNDNIIKFVYISRIMKEKGIDQYLEAAEFIRNKHPKTEFHVCGFCEEEYEEKLRMLNEKGIIIYHGLVSDVRNILRETHCTVHPTYYPEGMSNVLLESAACARPIITTDRSGCREIIDDSINGFICKQKDANDLIEKIERFLNLTYEDKRKMGLAGRKKVENEFDRNIVIDKYFNEIKKYG